MVVPLIALGGMALAGVLGVGASKIVSNVQDTKQAEIELEQTRVEGATSQALATSSPEQVATATPQIGDDIVLFLRKNAVPIVLLVFAFVVFIMVSKNGKK